MKQLYRVTFYGETMVLASSPEEAVREAEYAARAGSLEEVGIQSQGAEVLSSVSELASEWKGSIPYGKSEIVDETCQEFLERNARYAAHIETLNANTEGAQ